MSSRSITPSRPPWPSSTTDIVGLETKTFTRALTYGQIKGIKALLKVFKRLHAKTSLVDIAMNETNYGSPGNSNTYRVRVRYKTP